jgi:hypothetical protein
LSFLVSILQFSSKQFTAISLTSTCQISWVLWRITSLEYYSIYWHLHYQFCQRMID